MLGGCRSSLGEGEPAPTGYGDSLFISSLFSIGDLSSGVRRRLLGSVLTETMNTGLTRRIQRRGLFELNSSSIVSLLKRLRFSEFRLLEKDGPDTTKGILTWRLRARRISGEACP
jgi:hypothetical protein